MYVALNRDVLYLHLDKLNKSSFIPHIVFTNASTGKNNKMGDSSPIVDQTLTLEKMRGMFRLLLQHWILPLRVIYNMHIV